MRFSKWQALGNSYLVLEQPEAGELTAERVRRLCDFASGIGSDGVLEIVGHDDRRAEIVIWNPDGSVAEMSGNGVRIAARWLAAATGERDVTIVTADREIEARMLDGLDTFTDMGEVSVGEPEAIDAGETIELTSAVVGNPHAVIRRDTLERSDLLRIGPLVETHPRFPQRTNVQLVHVDGSHDLSVLVWERGAGETTASGSSSVAAAAVSVARGWCESPVIVHLPGGDLVVEVANGRASLTGPAEEMYRGTTPL